MSKDAALADARTSVLVLTRDSEFEGLVRSTFTTAQIALSVAPDEAQGLAQAPQASIVVMDIDAAEPDALLALQRLTAQLAGATPIVVVMRSFGEGAARALLQARISDFLVKPVQPIDLVRACARASQRPGEARVREAQIYTFLPGAGGVGVTTLAIQAAMLLMRSGARGPIATCLVDLNFQQGACADYLDLEPRLDLGEIEPSPERLDRQLLEIMISRHASGLSVIAAPNRPAEMRSFDPDMVTHLLDLVSTHFDYVVIDMPRTWFSWTDSVLVGSNHLFIVTEMTVPGLRHARHLVDAIGERLGDSPKPKVIVNRFEQRMFDTGLRRSDIEHALGPAFLGTVPNNYRLVREAIDRGVPLDEIKPGNNISGSLKKLILAPPPPPAKAAAPAVSAPAVPRERGLLWAR